MPFIWWDKTLTIYNKFEDPQTDVVTWYKTVVTNCFWKDVRNKVTIGDVTIDANQIIARIPQNSKFMEKYDWNKVPNDQKSNYFTLAQGDMIVKGDIDDDIDDYVNGSRSTDILEKYKYLGIMLIDRVSVNVGPGRTEPHYYVAGN